MATYKTIKRFAWIKKKLTDGTIIRWNSEYEELTDCPFCNENN